MPQRTDYSHAQSCSALIDVGCTVLLLTNRCLVESIATISLPCLHPVLHHTRPNAETLAIKCRFETHECILCRDVLIGSLAGGLNEVVIDEKDKKEKVAKRVFQLQDSKDPITSVYQHRASQGQRLVLMATTNRLYVFSGKGSLEAIFARYTSPGNTPRQPHLPPPCRVGCMPYQPNVQAVLARCQATIGLDCFAKRPAEEDCHPRPASKHLLSYSCC